MCPQTPLGNKLWKWLSMILATGILFFWDQFILFTLADKNKNPSDLKFSLFFVNKVRFPNWVRRNRHSMPTKCKQRKKKKRRPELNTRSPRRLFRGSWRTTRRWRLPLDTSKNSSDLSVKFFFLVLMCGSLNCQYDYADGISERSSMASARHHTVIALLAST